MLSLLALCVEVNAAVAADVVALERLEALDANAWSKSENRKGTNSRGVCMYSYDGKDPNTTFDEKLVTSLGHQQQGKITLDGGLRGYLEKPLDVSDQFDQPFMTWMNGAVRHDVSATWSSSHLPNTVNITWAHEKTHFELWVLHTANGEGKDKDHDFVPDTYEPLVGLNGKTKDTFGKAFRGSSKGSSAARDEEYFAWIGACFSPAASSKTLTHLKDAVPEVVGYSTGVVAPEADLDHDWSVSGKKWTESE